MRKHMENIIPAVVIVLLILVFALLVGNKVYAESVEAARTEQREVLESTYLTTMRDVLEENGFYNSGVNMTKATDEEGEWEYTVIIYNRSFEWMEDLAREELEKELVMIGEDSLGKISLDLLVR